MTSKAERIRIKRASRVGRPRKADVARYPGGQIKHGETEREVRSVALDARKRMHFRQARRRRCEPLCRLHARPHVPRRQADCA